MKVVDMSWQMWARDYYLAGHTARETFAHVHTTYGVSDRRFRKFMKESGINRGVSGAQKLKRFPCKCVSCERPFMGRTPTVLMCDLCVGDDCHGVTPSRMKKYQQFRKLASYGIDVVTYEAMLARQASKCGLCSRYLKVPCVDHDHVTGRVRGLLCHRCNLTLGQIELTDSCAWLRKAASWIGNR